MKTYKETTDSIFNKSAQAIRERKKRNMTIAGLSVAVCVCAIGIFSVSVFHNAVPHSPEVTPGSNTQIADNSPMNEGENDTTRPQESNTNESNNEQNAITADIHINVLDSYSAAAMDIALMWDDAVTKTPEELQEYYGTDIYPSVLPDNFISEILVDGGVYGNFMVFQNEERGVYHDQNTITYLSEDAMERYRELGYIDWTKPVIQVTVSKERDIFFDTVVAGLEESPLITSSINGNELVMCRFRDQLIAYFTKDDVHFEVDAYMLSEDEFVEVLAGYLPE